MSPITGIRYKCSVLKNFDYCELCEDRIPHDYPFLKISHPDNAPKFMFSAVPEESSPRRRHCGRRGPVDEGCKPWREMKRNFKEQFGPLKHMLKDPKVLEMGKGYIEMFEKMIDGEENKKEENNDQEERKESDPQQQQPELPNLTEEQKQLYKGYLEMAKKWIQIKELKREAKEQMPRGTWCKGKWSEKRAVIKKSPEEVLVGEPGQTVFAQIEVLNDTKWPWKRGCYLGLQANESGDDEVCPFTVAELPIEEDVKGMGTLNLSVPI